MHNFVLLLRYNVDLDCGLDTCDYREGLGQYSRRTTKFVAIKIVDSPTSTLFDVCDDVSRMLHKALQQSQ